ncbi:MAG: hypothetical protein H7844_12120 [Nitrospirae bacterium YQR-1]
MVRVNYLLFLFLIEFCVLFFGLSILLFIRGRRETIKIKTTGGSFSVEEFRDILNSELEKMTDNTDAFSETMGEEDVQKIIQHHVSEAKKNFVNSAIKSLDEGKGDYQNLWHNLYGLYEEVLEAVFTKLQAVSGEAGGVHDEDEVDHSTKGQPSAGQLRAVLAAQKRLMIDILGYKEVFTELVDEFEKIKASNVKIMESFEEQAASSEELQIVAMDLEKANKYIDKCSKALRKNIENISKKIEDSEQEPSLLKSQGREPRGDYTQTSLMDNESKGVLVEEEMQI